MWRFVLLQLGKLLLWLAGALLAAAVLSALTAPHGLKEFFTAFPARLSGYAHLNFGASSVDGMPVAQMVLAGLPKTLALLAWGALIAFAAGIPLAMAFGRGSIRRATAPLIQFAGSAPVFCGGLAIAWICHVLFQWQAAAHGDVGLALGLPAAVLRGDTAVAMAGFRQLLLPALTVGAAGAASVQLALRRAASQADNEPYRLGLRLMGLGTIEVERVYVLPQVFAGLLASTGEIMLALISAAAVAEWVFSWPGDAVLFVKSVALSDWNVAVLVLLVFAALKFTADFVGRTAARALDYGL